ncbi:phytanoyl-CoA dioxygenase [Mariprofundus micogutta]|uniref:Phytanoyl-CoA dioxygenase n=1 Tax=Mariprofundus micogutta TaxID=1921010 RepID=A0A1L8CLE3_9PROT|nr:phytanoyl-CoA dioxygenase family protein [Mariprofundus micogutta]GAV19740.1 phytanoyl-CoA dioxygenase [Mariprofundus micogutta]
MISDEDKSKFKKDGVLVLRGFYDLEKEIKPIQHAIYEIIGRVIGKNGFPIKQLPFSSDTFDSGFNELIGMNRGCGSEIYDAVKQIPAFIRLLANERHELIFSQLFDTKLPGIAAAGYGIRIDNPHEERFRASWHQEFLSQLRSMEGVVYWSPLVNITEELGPVEFSIGSQVEGVLPVRTSDPDDPEKTGAYGVRIVDEEKYLAKYPLVAPLTSPGDLVVLDWHVLHRSGRNIAQTSRWSMQMRYFNFDNEMGIKLGWCGSYSAGVDVKAILPEYILD